MEDILITEKIGLTESSKKAGKKLLAQVWRYKKTLIGGMVCSVFMTLMFNASALIVKNFIDDALGAKNIEKLVFYSWLMVAIFAVRWVFAYFATYLTTLGGLKVVEELRNKCYTSLQGMSFGFFENRRVGELVSRISNDTGVVQMFVTSGVSEAFRIPIAIISGLGIAIYMSPKLTLYAFIVLPAIAGVVAIAGKMMKNASIILQEQIASLNVILTEILSSMHIVKSFSMEEYEIERFAKENNLTVETTLTQVKIRALYSPMVELLGACGLAFILWVGGKDIINGAINPISGKPLTTGALLGIFIVLQQIFTQVNRINHVNLSLQHAFAAAERTFEIIDMKPDIREKHNAVVIPEIMGNIEFKNVFFSYNPDEVVLHDINVKVEPGMVVALVGSSGSGKSTFAKLLPRFYDVDSGSVTIEGVDIRDAKIASYRPQMGMVPQDTILFCATIKENIAYGRIGASDEEIYEAAKAAYAHDFIMEMPEGYDTMVGERGVTVSGGQRQRIAIARAILKDPRILILDEATSNVDNISEKYIQKALEKLMESRTTFVIAHRLTTIRDADIILVMENGRIVERGRHDELYEYNGAYRRLYDLTLQNGDD